MTFSELAKLMRDKRVETHYKRFRSGIRLELAKYISGAGGGALEKYLAPYAAEIEIDEVNADGRTFLDEMVKITKDMTALFDGLEFLDEAQQVKMLNSATMVMFDHLNNHAAEVRINCFAGVREKYTMNITEEQEVKNLMPGVAMKRIKTYIEHYMFLYRVASANKYGRGVYKKFRAMHDYFLAYEKSFFKTLKILENEKVKEHVSFMGDMRLMLLRFRKIFDIMGPSDFGTVSDSLMNAVRTFAIRLFIKLTPHPRITRLREREGYIIDLHKTVSIFDKLMGPLIKAARQHKAYRKANQGKMIVRQQSDIVYWDVSPMVRQFRNGMGLVIKEFAKGVRADDNQYRYFVLTVQNILIPYYTQQKGEVNDTFVKRVGEIEKFFWDVMMTAIENTLDSDVSFFEAIGLITDEEAAKKELKQRLVGYGVTPEDVMAKLETVTEFDDLADLVAKKPGGSEDAVL